MNIRSISAVLFAVALLPFHAANADPQIRLWISTSVNQNIMSKIKEPFEKKTGIKIIPAGDSAMPSTLYFKDVLDGKADAATSSTDFEDWLELMRKEKVPEEQLKTITYRVIGHDVMTVMSNKGVGVHSLKLEQIQKLFTGKAKNWRDVGGPDLPVQLVIASTKPATNVAFRKTAIKGAEFGGTIVDAKSFDEVVEKIAKTPGALGFGPAGTKSDSVSVVNTPPIGRPSTLITKGKPSPEVNKLVDFIRTEGRNYGVGE